MARKGFVEEKTQQKIIRMGYAKLFKFLRDPSIPLANKAPYAMRLVERSLPMITKEIGETNKSIVVNFIRDYVPPTNNVNNRIQSITNTEADNSI